MRPPRGRELGGVVHQVGERLGEAERIAADPQRLGGQIERERDPGLSEALPVALDGDTHEFCQVELLTLQLHLAAGDPGGLQEVVDQHRLMEDLALGGVDRPRSGLVPVPLQPQHLEGVADRAERVAQLVGEHREQFGLGLVGPLQRRALLRQPQGDLLQLGLAEAGALELRQHPVDPLVRRAVAEHHVGRLVEDVGADLVAQHGERMGVQGVLDRLGGGGFAGVAAESAGAAAGQEAVEVGLVLDQPVGAGDPLQHPAHVPCRAQAGEVVVERLLLGLAQEVHHRSGIEAAVGNPALPLGEEDQGAAVALGMDVHPGVLQGALQPPRTGAVADE